MAKTRAEKKIIFDTILVRILQVDVGGFLAKAFSDYGTTSTDDLMSLRHADIESLVYTNAQRVTTPVRRNERNLVHALQGFIYHNEQLNTTIGPDDWATLDPEIFNTFRTSVHYNPCLLYTSDAADE